MASTDVQSARLAIPSEAMAEAAEAAARRVYQRWLAQWAQDVLLARAADTLTPRWMPDSDAVAA